MACPAQQPTQTGPGPNFGRGFQTGPCVDGGSACEDRAGAADGQSATESSDGVSGDAAVGADTLGDITGNGGTDGGATTGTDGSVGAETVDGQGGVIGGTIGSACETHLDCTDSGAECVDWPEGSGICTLLHCDAGIACPAGTACIELMPSTWGCIPTCDGNSDCRPGYPCKALLQESGALLRVCHAVGSKAGGPASLCEYPIECKASATCVSDWPGGYCAALGCDPSTPCPSTTMCAAVEAVGNMCLKICDESKPCPGGLIKLQSCAPTETIDGETADLCVPGEVGKDLGEFCKASDECASGECDIVSIGTCSDNGFTCLTSLDCADGGDCVEDSNYIQGTCVQTCDAETPCPEETVCVPASADEGDCRPGCKGLSDVYTCEDAAGEVCAYGYPLESGDGEGAYACIGSKSGGVGSLCNAESGGGCGEDLYCLPAGGGLGMCVANCGDATPAGISLCPWTSACASVLGSTQCVKLCPKGDVECPDGFRCITKEIGLPFSMDLCADVTSG